MEICHEHNLNSAPETRKPYGVRVTLRSSDPLSNVLGQNFERVHWFATTIDRDRALADMSGEHLYSRQGDRPTLRFEPVDRS